MMRVFKWSLVFGLLLVISVKRAHAQKEIFIKQISFELTEVSDIEYENEYFVSMKFNKGSKYEFKITNNINDTPGIAILQLMDADNLVLTNTVGEKYYDVVNFVCNKTGFYDVLINFKDNHLGNCNIDIMLVQ